MTTSLSVQQTKCVMIRNLTAQYDRATGIRPPLSNRRPPGDLLAIRVALQQICFSQTGGFTTGEETYYRNPETREVVDVLSLHTDIQNLTSSIDMLIQTSPLTQEDSTKVDELIKQKSEHRANLLKLEKCNVLAGLVIPLARPLGVDLTSNIVAHTVHGTHEWVYLTGLVRLALLRDNPNLPAGSPKVDVAGTPLPALVNDTAQGLYPRERKEGQDFVDSLTDRIRADSFEGMGETEIDEFKSQMLVFFGEDGDVTPNTTLFLEQIKNKFYAVALDMAKAKVDPNYMKGQVLIDKVRRSVSNERAQHLDKEMLFKEAKTLFSTEVFANFKALFEAGQHADALQHAQDGVDPLYQEKQSTVYKLWSAIFDGAVANMTSTQRQELVSAFKCIYDDIVAQPTRAGTDKSPKERLYELVGEQDLEGYSKKFNQMISNYRWGTLKGYAIRAWNNPYAKGAIALTAGIGAFAIAYGSLILASHLTIWTSTLSAASFTKLSAMIGLKTVLGTTALTVAGVSAYAIHKGYTTARNLLTNTGYVVFWVAMVFFAAFIIANDRGAGIEMAVRLFGQLAIGIGSLVWGFQAVFLDRAQQENDRELGEVFDPAVMKAVWIYLLGEARTTGIVVPTRELFPDR